MALLDEVILDMQAAGRPTLPPGHPICDGKERRYGPKKKAWYKLMAVDRDGKRLVYGSFGYWQGDDNGAVGVTLKEGEVSKEELAAARRRAEEAARAEAEKRERLADAAANRAKLQWETGQPGTPAAPVACPYLQRKQVDQEGVRVTADGTLLVPMKRYSRDGVRLVGLQKILPDGTKTFNKGMDKVGAACLLGKVHDDSPLIMFGEGYASVESGRMAINREHPGVVAFDAGNLAAVARGFRRDFPAAHFLFLADDDWQLKKRLAKRLVKDFCIAATLEIDGEQQLLSEVDFADDKELDAKLKARLVAAAGVSAIISIDGVEQQLAADDGSTVRVTARWRKDENGVQYIEADVRSARVVRTLKLENTGIARATAVVREVGNASVVWPVFKDRGARKWTDFNDLHVEESLEAVRQQLLAAIDQALTKPGADPSPAPSDPAPPPEPIPIPDEAFPAPLPGSDAAGDTGFQGLEWALEHCALVQGSTDVWDSLNKIRMKKSGFLALVGKETAKAWEAHPKRKAISPRNLPRLHRGVAVDVGGGGDDIVDMLDRYTLLYGTKTVYDAEKNMVLSYDAMSLARGSDLATRWIEHPLHREVDQDKLVFDPTQRLPLDTHINMFRGFPLVPKQDDAKCDLVLELLHNLCSDEANSEIVFDWVVRWLAYPLQHPGAKMQTALLFFGEKQGTGKSLFFEGIMRPIYGPYGVTAGQYQLESQYTAWKSQKLYVVFEEILSRQDKYSHFGLIKHMITGRDHRLNEKHLPERTEANHLNAVMLSNELQAVPIEPEDRRFLVVESRSHPRPGLTDAIKALLDDGIIEAFYDFLLKYPLGDFDPHTKPVMTVSKQRVIRYGLPSWDAFHQAWSAGEIVGAPYCTCRTEDLYIVYKRWCESAGEKKLSLTKFSEFMSLRVPKERPHLLLGNSGKKKQYMAFIVQGDGQESLSAQCERFRKEADIQGGL